MAAHSTWTEERVELLLDCWRQGLSASQAAAVIGGVTRNSVIGKWHRIGLTRFVSKPLSYSERQNERRRQKRALERIARTEQRVVFNATPNPARVYAPKPVVGEPTPLATIATDTGSGCRWICGDPREASTQVCGHARYARAWCEHHYHRAYTGETIAQAERRRAREKAERALAEKVRAA